MKLEHLLTIFFLAGMAVCALIVFFSNKEQKKQTRIQLDKTRMDWANCLASVEKNHVREIDAFKQVIETKDEVIDAKNDLIAEKDRRIEQLEADIAMKDMILACAKVDGSVDIEKLKEMVGGPYIREELVYNE